MFECGSLTAKFLVPGAASWYNPGALGWRGGHHEDGLSVRESGSRLWDLRLGETALEPLEDCSDRGHGLHRVLADCQSGGSLATWHSGAVHGAAVGMLVCDARRGIPGPELRQRGDDRLLRSGQRG